MLPGMRTHRVICWLLLGSGCGAASCNLAMAPVRVVGSVAKHTYQAGERAVDASSKAIDEHKQKKAAATNAQAKDKPKQAAQTNTPPALVEPTAPPAQPTPTVPPAKPDVPVVAPPGTDPATLPPLPE